MGRNAVPNTSFAWLKERFKELAASVGGSQLPVASSEDVLEMFCAKKWCVRLRCDHTKKPAMMANMDRPMIAENPAVRPTLRVELIDWLVGCEV